MSAKGTMRSRLRWDSESREARVQHKQDVAPFLDAAKRRRDVEEYGGIDPNSGFQKVASLPLTVVLEIRDKYGIDVFSANRKQLRKVMQIIERDYPKLKTTNKRIGR